MKIKTIITLMIAVGLAFTPVMQPAYAIDLDDLDRYLYPEPEKTISMNFTNAELENVLKVFSQQSGLNFIVSANIGSDTVNLYLENVPVEEALEKILSANNLTYEIEPGSNIFVVKRQDSVPSPLMTRVYPLKFATVPSSNLHNTLTDLSSPGAGIVEAVESVLSEAGSVVEDARTNSVIVSDIPSQFPLIESAITRLDVRVPQILIEAELLDISKDTGDKMGFKFNGEGIGAITPASRNTAYPFNPDKVFGQGFLDKDYTEGTITFAGLATQLDFIRSQTDTKNLARPRILTLNNSTAEISIVTDEAIGLSSTTSSSEGQSESVAEAERVETGVSLKVTPQVNLNTREITMAIEPKVTVATQGESFGGNDFKDPEVRGTKTILRVNDGDTIIMGGLLKTEDTNIKTTVPILGQVPVLGAPFRHKNLTETQRELIIFITPHIVEDDAPLKTAMRNKKKIVREQSAPTNREMEIEKELSHVEKKKSAHRR